MIQEIYDYLLIRSHFLLNKDLLLELCSDKDNYKHIMHTIASFIQKENYLLTSSELVENVSDAMYKYRFEFCKDKEICDDINFIITRLNEYKSMSLKRKRYLVKEWINKEFKDRNLPFLQQVPQTFMNAMPNEHYLFMKICGFELNEEEGVFEKSTNDSYTKEEIDIFGYLQLINLLISRFPYFFYDLENLENTLINLFEIVESKQSLLLTKYARKTYKSLKPILKDISVLKEELGYEKRLNN